MGDAGDRQRGRQTVTSAATARRADELLTERQTMLHLLGCRRRASGQAAALGSDKRATTALSDGRVVSLFRRQSDGAVGKTVIKR